MTIIRGAGAGDAVVAILRSAAQDERLSFRARGVLVAVMSRPADWRTSYRRLATEGREGERAVLAALAELEEYGYLRRRRRHDGKRIRTDWEISDDPGLTGQRFLQPTELQPTKQQPTKQQPTNLRLPKEGETEGRTPPPTPAAESPSSDVADLVVVVVGEAQKGRCPKPERAVIADACRPLPDRGWTPEQLRAAIRARDWTGARPGAVIAWLRRLEAPQDAPGRPQERPPWCGACDEPSRRLLDAQGRPRRGTKCPHCHPDNARRAS